MILTTVLVYVCSCCEVAAVFGSSQLEGNAVTSHRLLLTRHVDEEYVTSHRKMIPSLKF